MITSFLFGIFTFYAIQVHSYNPQNFKTRPILQEKHFTIVISETCIRICYMLVLSNYFSRQFGLKNTCLHICCFKVKPRFGLSWESFRKNETSLLAFIMTAVDHASFYDKSQKQSRFVICLTANAKTIGNCHTSFVRCIFNSLS